MKAVSVNAYVNKDGKKFVVIKLDNGQAVFINSGLVKYALDNEKPVKSK